jgi:hypothetical protein
MEKTFNTNVQSAVLNQYDYVTHILYFKPAQKLNTILPNNFNTYLLKFLANESEANNHFDWFNYYKTCFEKKSLSNLPSFKNLGKVAPKNGVPYVIPYKKLKSKPIIPAIRIVKNIQRFAFYIYIFICGQWRKVEISSDLYYLLILYLIKGAFKILEALLILYEDTMVIIFDEAPVIRKTNWPPLGGILQGKFQDLLREFLEKDRERYFTRWVLPFNKFVIEKGKIFFLNEEIQKQWLVFCKIDKYINQIPSITEFLRERFMKMYTINIASGSARDFKVLMSQYADYRKNINFIFLLKNVIENIFNKSFFDYCTAQPQHLIVLLAESLVIIGLYKSRKQLLNSIKEIINLWKNMFIEDFSLNFILFVANLLNFIITLYVKLYYYPSLLMYLHLSSFDERDISDNPLSNNLYRIDNEFYSSMIAESFANFFTCMCLGFQIFYLCNIFELFF